MLDGLTLRLARRDSICWMSWLIMWFLRIIAANSPLTQGASLAVIRTIRTTVTARIQKLIVRTLPAERLLRDPRSLTQALEKASHPVRLELIVRKDDPA